MVITRVHHIAENSAPDSVNQTADSKSIDLTINSADHMERAQPKAFSVSSASNVSGKTGTIKHRTEGKTADSTSLARENRTVSCLLSVCFLVVPFSGNEQLVEAYRARPSCISNGVMKLSMKSIVTVGVGKQERRIVVNKPEGDTSTKFSPFGLNRKGSAREIGNFTFMCSPAPPAFGQVNSLFLSGNHLQKLKGLEQFCKITRLSLSNNDISDVYQLFYLPTGIQELSMEACPVTQSPLYTTFALRRLPNLRLLDGKDVATLREKLQFYDKV